VFINIDSIEVPILDGSAEPFMQMLEQAGTRRLRKRRRYLKVLSRSKSSKWPAHRIYPPTNFM